MNPSGKSFFRKILIISVVLMAGGLFYLGYLLAQPSINETLQSYIQKRVQAKAFYSTCGEALYSSAAVRSFYKTSQYQAAWFDSNYRYNNARILSNILQDADQEALVTKDYHRKRISALLPRTSLWMEQGQTDSLADFDLLLTDALLAYARDLATGQFSGNKMNVNQAENLKAIPFNAMFKNALDSQRLATALNRLVPKNGRYMELKKALAFYRAIAAGGGLASLPDALSKLKAGDTSHFIIPLRQYLGQLGINSNPKNMSPRLDSSLQASIKEYQRLHGLKETGLVNAATLKDMQLPVEDRIMQIMANMERLRWLPGALGDQYIMVNIADFSVQVVEGDSAVIKMKIIVGTPYKQTPVFHAHMQNVVINPYWDVPNSIATEEILPILRRNPGYLAHNHMKLYNTAGIEVSPYAVNWWRLSKTYFPYHIRQLPGPWNSLGSIKFLFPNPFSVYLHGTPYQSLFEQDVRTFSHGCMRLEDPLRLAIYLLKGNDGWTREKILAKIATREEQFILIKPFIPVHVTYQSVWIDKQGKLNFRNDVYGRDELFRPYLKALPLAGLWATRSDSPERR